MTMTLREIYDDRKLQETTAVKLIIEAMEDDDFKKATVVIEKLKALKAKCQNLPTLSSAIDEMVKDVNKYTGGGLLAKAAAKIKGGLGMDNPIVKMSVMANALQSGFKLLPQILKNNLDADEMKNNPDKSIEDLLADKPDELATIKKNIYKAFTAKGVLGRQKGIPYIKQDQLIADMMSAKVSELRDVTLEAANIPQPPPELVDAAKQAPGAEGTAGTTKTQSTDIDTLAAAVADKMKIKGDDSTKKAVVDNIKKMLGILKDGGHLK